MSVMHLGTFNAEELVALLPAEHKPSRCLGVDEHPSRWRFEHGDSWEEWGEGLNPESGHPERVVVYGESHELMADLAWILDQNPGLLQPMTFHPYQHGALAVITPEDDESEPWFTVYEEQAQRFIQRLVAAGADPHGMWQNAEWRERQGLPALPASEE